MVSLVTVAWMQCTRQGQRKREVVAFAGAYLLSDYARYEIFQTAVLRCRAAAAACHRSGLLTRPLLVIVEWVMVICYPSTHENRFHPWIMRELSGSKALVQRYERRPDHGISNRLDSLDSARRHDQH